jgi:PAS domain S-box-containing protein
VDRDKLRYEGKDDLLGELEVYPAGEVDDVLARVSTAIGDHNAPNFDAELHALTVTRDVLRGRYRDELTEELAPRITAADDQLWLADEDTVLAVSPAAAASLGYTPEELVGRSGEQLRPDGHDWSAERRRLYEDGARDGVLLLRHKDGRTVPVSYAAKIITLAGRRLRFGRTRALVPSTGATTGDRVGRFLSEALTVAAML